MPVSHFAVYNPAVNGDNFPQSRLGQYDNAHNGYYVK